VQPQYQEQTYPVGIEPTITHNHGGVKPPAPSTQEQYQLTELTHQYTNRENLIGKEYSGLIHPVHGGKELSQTKGLDGQHSQVTLGFEGKLKAIVSY